MQIATLQSSCMKVGMHCGSHWRITITNDSMQRKLRYRMLKESKVRPPKEPMTYAPIRLSAKCLEKLQRMREIETRKQMYPVTRADVMRTCIALGLAAWEKQADLRL